MREAKRGNELEVEQREEFHKDAICPTSMQLSLTFWHPLGSLPVRASWHSATPPLKALGGQQSTWVTNTETHLWSADTGQKWEEELWKKCHPPSQLDPKTKEPLCFNSCSHRPSLAREQGHWWGRNAIKSQVPSFQSWVVVSLLPPTGQLQHELLPKPTVKFNLHSLQEKKKSLSLPGILLWCKSCRLWHASHIHTRCGVGGGVSRWSFSVEQGSQQSVVFGQKGSASPENSL